MSLVSDKVTNTTPLPRFLSLSRYGRRPFKYFIYTLATFLALWIVLFRNNQVLVTPPQAKEESLWQWTAVEEIFAFGDSWTTTEFDPNGPAPRMENPMGNPEFPVDRFKRTPDWIEYMTGVYNKSFIRTYNLARGAATIDRDIVLPLFPSTWCFDEQVNDQFSHRYSQAPISSIPNRLFIVLFGLVDLALLTREGPVADAILGRIAGRYEDALHQLYDLGARHFLLFTIPPIDRAPDPQSPLDLKVAIEAFNMRIYSIRERMRSAHAQDARFRIRVFDVHALLGALLYDPTVMPQTKEIKNVTKNCWDYNPDVFTGEKSQPWDYLDLDKCGVRRDEYFWANTLHVTHPVQEAIAAAVVEECFERMKTDGLCG